METEETYVCRICDREKERDDFYWFFQKNIGRVCRRTECKQCNNGKTRKYAQENRDYYIFQNARAGDRRAKREFDLTREDVKNLLENECVYCGETNYEVMSIDRKDSSRGHTRDNVVSACIRCNIVKMDMPYEAWLQLAPGMRTSRLQGLFKEWLPNTHLRFQKKIGKF